jgi:hypothetical protein
MRVHELASELGVPSSLVIQRAQRLGRPLRSVATVLPAEWERDLRRSFGRPPGLADMSPVVDDELAAMGRSLGVDPALLAPRRPPAVPHRSPRRRTAERVAPGTLFQSTAELNEAAVAERWAKRFIAPDERRAWRNAGLGAYDDAIAETCVTNGLYPDNLRMVVDGQSIVSRLRGGESIGSVIARLRAGPPLPPIRALGWHMVTHPVESSPVLGQDQPRCQPSR